MELKRQNLKWASRFVLIALLIGAADALVIMFARRPFPWVVVIPALTPLLVVAFIIAPLGRAEKAKRLP
jgi:hypothetical protein